MTVTEKPTFNLPKAPGAIINGVVGRVDDEKGRFYIRPTDQLVLNSVTNILDVTSDSSFLKNWYADLAGQVVVTHAQKIAAIRGGDIDAKLVEAVNKHNKFKAKISELEGDELEDFIRRSAVRLFVGEEVRKLSEIKADIGSYQHWVLEAMVLDQPIPEIPEHLIGADVDGERCDLEFLDEISDGLLNFFTDFPTAVVVMAEATVACPSLGTAGTLDLIIYIPEGLTIDGVTYHYLLVDLKTGKHLDPKKMPHQLAAYRYSTEVWVDSLGNIAPMIEVDGAAILHLRKDYENGYKLIIVEAGPEQFEQFAGRVAVFRGQENAPNRIGSIAYPPLPDGSQPLPYLEDIPELSGCQKKLRAAGLRRLEDLASFTASDIHAIKGVGKVALANCEETLSRYGLSFAAMGGAA